MARHLFLSIFALLSFGLCVDHASAGLYPLRTLENSIQIPMLYATFNSDESELVVIGKAGTLNGSTGEITMADFRLDAKLDPLGIMAPKGSFYIKNGTTEFLRGTITEANTAAFADGRLEFLADANLRGTLAELYGGVVGIKIDLTQTVSRLGTQGFSLGLSTGFQLMMGTSAEVGRPVPEPSSLIIMSSTLLVTLVRGRRRRVRRAC